MSMNCFFVSVGVFTCVFSLVIKINMIARSGMLGLLAVVASAASLTLPCTASARATSLRTRASTSYMSDGLGEEDKEQQKQRMETELAAKRVAVDSKWAEFYTVPNGPSAPDKRAELKAAAVELESDIEELEKMLVELQGGKGSVYLPSCLSFYQPAFPRTVYMHSLCIHLATVHSPFRVLASQP